jgi:hypothetical protein
MAMRKLVRLLFTLAVLAGATVAGISAATAVAGDTPLDEQTAPDPTPVPGTMSVETATDDPSGGAQWAVRVWVDQAGRTCADFGREVGDELGLIDGDGTFHARRPEDAGGNCGDPGEASGAIVAATYYPDDPTTDSYEPPRTVVHGVAGPDVTRVAVAWPDGDRLLRVSPRKAFISVYGGGVSSVPVTVTHEDGRSEVLEMRLNLG